MGFITKLKKLEDFFAPIEVEDELYVDEEEEVEVEQESRKVVGGSSVEAVKPAVAPSKKPNLTLHTNNSLKAIDLKIQVFVPQRFDDVREIADALKARQAAIVNYERIELPEQQRICDFLNGVCYVQDGFLHRISNTMVLYAPNGVEIDEIKSTGVAAI
ncbi:MAG: cell division protein SepF [Anaerovibrio sp.]|uniref:cell division protein SepF n=1 Tax=Anaerovibrio sp. TaxID=1872532 RepID=UPI0025E45FB3|nr:cell division protein SepF [Anaerovibrio sp.]MCR5175955.1 cell division protein SepF [Anaerovibrio sp.]